MSASPHLKWGLLRSNADQTWPVKAPLGANTETLTRASGAAFESEPEATHITLALRGCVIKLSRKDKALSLPISEEGYPAPIR